MSTTSGSGNSDPALRELFAAEVDMHLPVLSAGLLALEKGRATSLDIESMLRAAHSIKGAARIVGIDQAVRIAHAMEDCFTAAKEGRIALGGDGVDILLEGLDALQRACSPEEPGLGEESLTALQERMARLRDGRTVAAPMPASPALPGGGPSTPATTVFPPDCDAAAAEALRAQWCDRLARGEVPIRLNFSKVQHIRVTTACLLLSLADAVKSMGDPPVVEAHGVPPGVRELFRVLGLDRALAVRD